jgi:hypothetical protein
VLLALTKALKEVFEEGRKIMKSSENFKAMREISHVSDHEMTMMQKKILSFRVGIRTKGGRRGRN